MKALTLTDNSFGGGLLMKALTLTDNRFCWWFINESTDTDRQ